EGAGEYHAEMEALLNLLLAAQKPHGGFGYPSKSTGDTSMTQYGALGMWACQIAGIPVPVDNWERLSNWLLRTQDPSGGYGYQGTDPGGFNLAQQDAVRQSMTAAALGSLAICAESLRLFAAVETASSGPPQLRKVVKQEEMRTKNVDTRLVTEALRRGQGWLAAHYTPDFKVDLDPTGNLWTAYYMYALERCKSFVALLPPRDKDDNKWYDDGYAHLAKTQAANGSWESTGYEMTAPNTAFALLFLFRSTQKIIQRAKAYGGGLLVGGRGLPGNASDLELGPGGLRAKPLKGPATDLLQKLADPNDPKFEEAVRGMEAQSLVEEGDRLTEVQKRLRQMAAGKSPAARAAALKLLGRTRNLDNVPLLIEALHDDDPLVIVAATEALQFMARRFRPAGEFGVDAGARKQAVQYWKAWYRETRPEAQFDDD
ncbi:MAG TPA: HEAT repeat domain-containing protein, partial [Pirellulales bacterium]|nr:HEAT repeat domain-containing protein [Pirellulales bacterium]